MAVAFLNQLLEQHGCASQFFHLLAERFHVVQQIHLLAEGTEALLEHDGEAQRFDNLIQKRKIGISYVGKSFWRKNGARHGNAVRLELQIGLRLVIAPQNALRGVEHPHAQIFQLHGQLHVLVPEEYKIVLGGIKSISPHDGAQLGIGGHIQRHAALLRRIQQNMIQIVKFGGAQKSVHHHQSFVHTITSYCIV